MFRNLLLPAILCLTLSFVCLAQGNPQSQSKVMRSKDYQEIERLEVEWNTINEVSDADGVQRMLADDSYHVGPSGRLYNKSQDVTAQRQASKRKKASNSFPKFLIQERRIRLFKGVAIVTGLGASVGTKDGKEQITNQFRFVHVWERRDRRWQLTVDQVTAFNMPLVQQKPTGVPTVKPQK